MQCRQPSFTRCATSQTTYSTATNLESLLVLDLVLDLESPLELLDLLLDPDEVPLLEDESLEEEPEVDPEPEPSRVSFLDLPVGAVVGVTA